MSCPACASSNTAGAMSAQPSAIITFLKSPMTKIVSADRKIGPKSRAIDAAPAQILSNCGIISRVMQDRPRDEVGKEGDEEQVVPKRASWAWHACRPARRSA